MHTFSVSAGNHLPSPVTALPLTLPQPHCAYQPHSHRAELPRGIIPLPICFHRSLVKEQCRGRLGNAPGVCGGNPSIGSTPHSLTAACSPWENRDIYQANKRASFHETSPELSTLDARCCRVVVAVTVLLCISPLCQHMSSWKGWQWMWAGRTACRVLGPDHRVGGCLEMPAAIQSQSAFQASSSLGTQQRCEGL